MQIVKREMELFFQSKKKGEVDDFALLLAYQSGLIVVYIKQ